MHTLNSTVAISLLSLCLISNAHARTNIPYEEGMVLGRGYNSLTSNVLTNCLTSKYSTPLKVIRPDGVKAGGTTTQFELRIVEDESELNSILRVNASAKYSGSANFSASVKFAESRQINSYSVYYAVVVRIDAGIEQIDDFELSDDFKVLLASNPNRFRERCGDTFIEAQSLGGEFVSLLSIQTKSEEEKRNFSAKLKAMAGSFSAKGDFDRRFEEVTTGKEVSVSVFQIGGQDNELGATTPENLMEMVKRFPEDLRRNGYRPYRAIISDYRKLDLGNDSFVDQLNNTVQKEKIESYSRGADKVRRFINDASFVLDNPESFAIEDRNELIAYVENASNILDAATDKIRLCIADASECHSDVSLLSLETKLPARIETELTKDELALSLGLANIKYISYVDLCERRRVETEDRYERTRVDMETRISFLEASLEDARNKIAAFEEDARNR